MAQIPRVILIGGAPTTGKTTLARAIGKRLDRAVVSTDDLGQATRAVVSRDLLPDLHAADAVDFRQYYQDHGVTDLLEHAMTAHRALWPGIRQVIESHLTWSTPAVIEGWSLLPETVITLDTTELGAVWIGVPPITLQSRVTADVDFYRGARNEQLMIERFVGRSVAFTDMLREDTTRLGQTFVNVEVGQSTMAEVAKALGLPDFDT